jgi:trk system potassium uptake protein TrkA
LCVAEDTQKVIELFGYTKDEKNNVVIIGGNELCQEIVETTFREDVSIKVIESDLAIAEKLSEKLDDVEILHGNPFDDGVLAIADVRAANVVISMTPDDKTNILS